MRTSEDLTLQQTFPKRTTPKLHTPMKIARTTATTSRMAILSLLLLTVPAFGFTFEVSPVRHASPGCWNGEIKVDITPSHQFEFFRITVTRDSDGWRFGPYCGFNDAHIDERQPYHFITEVGGLPAGHYRVEVELQATPFNCDIITDSYVSPIVTINESEPRPQGPAIIHPGNIVKALTGNQCGGMNVSWSDPNLENYRDTVCWSYTVPNGSYFPVGTTQVTGTADFCASGACYTTSSYTFTVTVEDKSPPHLPDTDPWRNLVPIPLVVGQSILDVFGTPVAIDNCSGQVQGTTTDPTTIWEAGDHWIRWSFRDDAGNVMSSDFRVRIVAQIDSNGFLNGGFESPQIAGGIIALAQNGVKVGELSNWSISAGSRENSHLLLQRGSALEGDQRVEFGDGGVYLYTDGSGTPMYDYSGSGCSISQTFSTVVGHHYVVKYYIGSPTFLWWPLAMNCVIRAADGSVLASSVDSHFGSDASWSPQSKLNFAAVGAETTIEFSDATSRMVSEPVPRLLVLGLCMTLCG